MRARDASQSLFALVAALLLGSSPCVEPALAITRAHRRQVVALALPHSHRVPVRAPSGPPLGGGSAGAASEGEQTAGIPSAAGDQLVENGLASPLCKGTVAGRLSSAAQEDCRTSGFVGAPAPTNDYALDVHIDTGAFGLSKGGLLSVVQDVFITPAWGALEWLVHALVVMLEWCYMLELLGGASTSTVASALIHARAGFTDPWLALVLALASVLALYHGLVRRRVADTLGGALTMLAMMAGGLWVIADPAGTVGAIGRWADQASLGTLGATASGSPAGAAATLGDSMRALYAGAIETPWCYLEFGNVRWCGDPALLDPHLHAAALALVARGGAHGSVAAHSAELARAATTNGALFLAFPANGPARNSINDEGSLLRAICRSEEATKCTGPDAAEAEFRTDGGTFPRVLGLLAIAVGVLGMALLFGLIALRLLASAFLGLFLLLLAPFAVLAPAFGDGGRAVFAGWLTRLLGAVTSKLLFSFVLGALLTMQRVLVALDTLGWWTQWLLVSAFWWTVFLKRHQAAAVLRGAGRPAGRERAWRSGGSERAGGLRNAGGGPGGRSAGHGRWPLARRAERSLQTYGAIRHPGRWVEAQVSSRIAQPLPREEKLGTGRRESAALDSGSREMRAGAGTSTAVSTPTMRARDGACAALATNHMERSAVGGPSDSSDTGVSLERSEQGGRPDEVRPERARFARARGGSRDGGRERTPPAPGGRREVATDASPTRPPRSPGVAGNEAMASDEAREGRPADDPGDATGLLGRPRPSGDVRSAVMEDAFAVAQRRKRQLGFDSK